MLLKMSEVYVPVLVNYDGDEIEQLLRNVHLEETETNNGGDGNNCNFHVNSQASLFVVVWSPTDETPNGKARLAPDEGTEGERHQEGGPCQRPALLTATNAGTSATPSLPEQIGLVPETPQDPLEGTVMETYCTDDNGPEVDVAVALSEKTKLRNVLLRAEHHRTFTERCRQAHIIPTGLKHNRKVHQIKGMDDPTCRTKSIVLSKKLKWTF